MKLSELKLIASDICNSNDFDLNLSHPDDADTDFHNLKKYPFGRGTEGLEEIHSAWRSLRKLIRELEGLKRNQSYAQVAICLADYSVSDLAAKTRGET